MLWLLVACIILRTVNAPNPLRISTPHAEEIYAWQTQAWIHGQTSLLVEPDPHLASLPNPYNPDANRRFRILDLSYYHGKYYSYFGVAPILTLFLPWKVAFGTYLQQTFAVALFEIAAIGVAMLLLHSLWSLQGGGTLLVPVTAALVVSFGDLDLLHWEYPTYNQVAQVCGSFYIALAFYLAHRTLQSERRGTTWLALTSLASGMAVASRPSLLFIGLLPLVCAWAVGRRRDASGPVRAAAAGLVPFAAIVAGILVHNAVRFGNPLEFGMHFQLLDLDLTKTVMAGPRYFLPNLRAFLFEPPAFVASFPFVQSNPAAPLGMIAGLPFFLFGLGWLRTRQCDARVRILGFAMLGVSVAVCGLLCCYFVGCMRYETDFTVPWMICAACGWVVLCSGREGGHRRLLVGAGVAAALYTVLVNLMLATPFYAFPARLQGLRAVLNRIEYKFEAATGSAYGPLRLVVTFPETASTQRLPLVASGAYGQDVLYARVLEKGSVVLGLDHMGAAGPESTILKIDPTKPHVIEFRAGNLLPEADAPFFDGIPDSQVFSLRHRLIVSLDGKRVIDSDMAFFEGSARAVKVGTLRRPADGYAMAFPDPTIKSERLPFVASEWNYLPTREQTLRLRVRFVLGNRAIAEPLVGRGTPVAGDLLYVRRSEDGSAVFGIISSDGHNLEGPSVKLPGSPEHELDYQIMPPSREGNSGRRYVVARFDGTYVLFGPWDFTPSAPDFSSFGINLVDWRRLEQTFSGTVSPMEGNPGGSAAAYDSANVKVLFALSRVHPHVGEPLLEAGKTGASDMIYLVADEHGRVRLGLDHWGVGGALSEPVAFDAALPHTLRVETTGWPGGSAEATKVRVFLDDIAVLNVSSTLYPIGPGGFRAGENPAGNSTAEPTLDGSARLLDSSGP